MLSEVYLAQAEHRERLRAFNERAARGEFVWRQLPRSERRIGLAERLRGLALVIRRQWSGSRLQSLRTRTESSG
jgi:hypothetical protein